jgi:SOS-response transcriptional repressor LexA
MQTSLPSKKQKELLIFIDSFIENNGYSPSYREIMTALGYKSVSTVSTHIDNLIAKGYLLKQDNAARTLEVPPSYLSSLQGQDDQLAEAKGSLHERWLHDTVINKTEALVLNSTSQQIHDVQILVDALNILNMHEAYMEAKGRLEDYTKRLDQTLL